MRVDIKQPCTISLEMLSEGDAFRTVGLGQLTDQELYMKTQSVGGLTAVNLKNGHLTSIHYQSRVLKVDGVFRGIVGSVALSLPEAS